MEKYLFKDRYFAISEEGLHLLRNGYNFKTIPMAEIQSIRVGRGKSIKNWLLLLAVGIAAIGGGLYYGRGIWYFLTSPEAEGKIHALVIVAVIMSIFLGGYLVFTALKKENVIEFKINKSSESFAPDTLSKKGELEPLIAFLNQKKTVIKE